jgi:uncharacterized protein YcbX
MMQPLTAETIRPGTRIRYRNGRWATIIEVRKSVSQMHEVAVWDDSWGGENGSRRMDSWASRRYMTRVAVIGDPAADPNPTIHANWVVHTEEAE